MASLSSSSSLSGVSATAAASYYYKPPLQERFNERKDSTASSVSNKSIENPLLDRDPPPLVTAPTGVIDRQQTTASSFSFDWSTTSGLRHRRPGGGVGVTFRDDKENDRSLSTATSLVPVGGGGRGGGSFGGFKSPPRASASLGTHTPGLAIGGGAADPYDASSSTTTRMMARHSVATTTSTIPELQSSTANCWVLVFGYATAEQYHELLAKFSSYGHVLSHRGLCQPGQSNWIAIQYANELQAKKATCHSYVKLSGSSIYCGVIPLANDDPILVHQYHGPRHHHGMAGTTTSTSTAPSSLWAQPSSAASTEVGSDSTAGTLVQGGLTEKDILIRGHVSLPSRDNICNRVMRWIMGIPADIE